MPFPSRRTLLLVNLGKTDARPRLDPGFVAGTAWTNLLDDGAPAAPDAMLRPMQVRIVGNALKSFPLRHQLSASHRRSP
jgi:hypothetical protein